MRLHPHVAGLFVVADPRWRQKIFRGGLYLLLLPPLGWPAILGYRKELVRHLLNDLPEPLPSWQGRFAEYALEGLKAMGVIFGYFLPLYAALGALVLSRGFVPDARVAWLALVFIAFPIFSPLSFPIACLLFAFGTDPAWIGPYELAALLLAFALAVFLLPAGFLRVSLTGRYLSAFEVWRTLPFVAKNFRLYTQAWWASGLVSLFGHLALPFSPWGVMWAYGAIIFLFNEVLLAARLIPNRGGLARALADPRFAARRPRGRSQLEDGSGATVAVLSLGAFSVPLPRLAARWLGAAS